MPIIGPDKEGGHMAEFDWKRLSRQDQIVIGAGLLGFIALFLPWYGASVIGYSASVSGWSTSYGWLGGLLIVAAGAVLALWRAKAIKLPQSVGPAVLVFGLSLIGTVIVILRWITLPKGGGGVAGLATYSYGPRYGIFIALVVGIVQAIVAFMMFRASHEQLPWQVKTTDPPSATS
jgi:hypothetical protein